MVQTYEPAGPGMIVCVSGGGFVKTAEHTALEAELEKAKAHIADLNRAQYCSEEFAQKTIDILEADLAAKTAECERFRVAIEKIIQNHMDLPLSGRRRCLEIAQATLSGGES